MNQDNFDEVYYINIDAEIFNTSKSVGWNILRTKNLNKIQIEHHK